MKLLEVLFLLFMLILWAIDRLWDALVFVLQVVWGVVTLKPFRTRKRKTPKNTITMSKSENEEPRPYRRGFLLATGCKQPVPHRAYPASEHSV